MNFSLRTDWPDEENPLAKKLTELKRQNVPVLDLTVSNPTQCGFQYLHPDLLKPFSDPQNLIYDPDPHGLLGAREAVCGYYAQKGMSLAPDQIFLTANTSEAYTFLFKLVCDPGDPLLAPQPSYPILDYLADLNNLHVIRYPLLSGSAWAIDFKHVENIRNTKPSAFLTVHPNNPTGSYVKIREREILNELCKKKGCAVIADEVFFDFQIDESQRHSSFASNQEVLTFTLSGISKILGLPQMKLSWIVGILCAITHNVAYVVFEIMLCCSLNSLLSLWLLFSDTT